MYIQMQRRKSIHDERSPDRYQRKRPARWPRSRQVQPAPAVTNLEKEANMSLDTQLSQAIAQIPECVAGGYVDIGSGMLLSVKTVDSHPQEVLALVSAATADLFAGKNVVAIEKMFKKSRGLKDDGAHYFQEILVNSDNLIHVFMRGKRYQDYVAVFVCRKSANLGMVLTKARMAVPELEAAV